MAKNALVISGGGAKGAFAVGVLKYISQNTQIKFDIICGTSTGSLIAPYAALGDINTLETVYTTSRTQDILLKGDISERLLKENSLFDVSPLIKLVKKFCTQQVFDAVMASGKQVFLATVCLQTGNVVHFCTHDVAAGEGYEVIRIKTLDDMIRAIIASSNQPVFTPPIRIPATGPEIRQYVDGGVREWAPITAALDNGATDIYAICLSPEKNPVVNEEFKDAFSILLRTIGMFSEDVGENDIMIPQIYNRSLLYLEEVKKKIAATGKLTVAEIGQLFDIEENPFRGKKLIKLHVIRPEFLLKGMGGLEFDPPEMKNYLNHGFDIAKKYFEAPGNLPV